MSYEPTKWQTGDIITLNKLNKLEQGVAAMMEEYEPTVWQIGDTVTSTKLNKLEQAVATLSENNSGFGGGGTTLGALQNAVLTLDMTSYEGTLIGTTTIPTGISGASIGNNAAFASEPAINGLDSVTTIAAGMTATFSTSFEVTSVYIVTVNIEGNVIVTAKEWDGSFTCVEDPYGSNYLTTLTMPELDAYEDGGLSPYGGEVLLLAPTLE